jgi:hypothetical protein
MNLNLFAKPSLKCKAMKFSMNQQAIALLIEVQIDAPAGLEAVIEERV